MKWKFLKISSFFFGFLALFSLFSPLKTFAHEVAEFSGFSEEERQSINRQVGHLYSDNSGSHYTDVYHLVYRTKENYNERNNLKVVSYTCEYIDFSNYFYLSDGVSYDYSKMKKTINGCGSYLNYDKNSGLYTINIKYYNRLDSTFDNKNKVLSVGGYANINQNGLDNKQNVESTADSDFFVIYADSKNQVNEFDIRPQSRTDIQYNQNNNSGSSGGFGLFDDIKNFFSGIFKGIENFISDFFAPMRKSLGQAEKFLNKQVDQVGKDFSRTIEIISKFFEQVGKDFARTIEIISNFFVEFGKFIVHLLIPTKEDFEQRFNQANKQIEDVFHPFNTMLGSLRINNGNAHHSDQNLKETWRYGHTTILNTQDLLNGIKSAPASLLGLARAFLYFVLAWWVLDRLFKLMSVLLGTVYFWERWNKKEEN